jgi:hypothetical protein
VERTDISGGLDKLEEIIYCILININYIL